MQKYTSVISFFLILLISSYSNIVGAETLVYGQKYTVSKLNGVPQNDVNCIFQDSKGFIWIGTLDGLHRYDGYNYKTYQTGNNINTINSNLISAINEDNLGNIWVATFDKGICKLDPTTEEFTDFSDEIKYSEKSLIYDVEVMSIDQNNVMWLAHKNNIIRVRLDEQNEHVIDLTVMLETNSETKAIHYDTNGELWVGASHELVRIKNPYSENDKLKTEQFDLHVQSICESENEIIAVGAALYVFTAEEGKTNFKYHLDVHEEIKGTKVLLNDDRMWIGGRNGVESYVRDELSQWKKDTKFNGNFGNLGLGSNVVFSLLLAPNSGIWVGTRGSGINRIDLTPKRFEHFKHTKKTGALSNDLVRCVFQDSYGQVWIVLLLVYP